MLVELLIRLLLLMNVSFQHVLIRSNVLSAKLWLRVYVTL
jgi:hypothetical protein